MNIIYTIIIGAISGFIGAVAGGGSLISIPFLIFLGIPPQIALATNKFGGLGLSAGGLFKFIKEKKIVWKYAVFLSVFGFLGSLIGSQILITTKEDSLQKLIGLLLIALVPTIFLKRNFGIEEKPVSITRITIGGFIYFILGIIASFFGGLGAITISVVIFFFGLSIIRANATELFSYTILSISSVVIYASNRIIDYKIGVVLFLGMLVGGYLGAHIAIKKGDKWVKIFFTVVVIFSAIKILLG